MKKTLLFIAGLLTSASCFGQASPPYSVADSITIFYDSLFHELETKYLHRHDVNWDSLQPEILRIALTHTSFETSLTEVTPLFDAIGGDHLNLFSPEGWYKSTLKPQLSQEDFSRELLEKYAQGAELEGKVLADGYGYLLVPPMLLLDADQEELNAAAQSIARTVDSLSATTTIKGWVIDLRLNIGGNANVMIAGLYRLLGNSSTYTTVYGDGTIKLLNTLKGGRFYQNEELLVEVATDAAPTPEVPVALLTSKLTASAGEFVVLGFRGRKNVTVIGEESYGLTSSNDLFSLPFGTTITLTLSYGADRKGRHTASIVPDIFVEKGDNYTDLTKDKNVMEAIKFIDLRSTQRDKSR